jgi:hypothetical protein
MLDTAPSPQAGLTVADVARRYRVGEDKVRGWIGRGELFAVNTATVLCGKPRWVIPPEALAEFERRRAGGPTPKPRRRPRQTGLVDYFPDTPAERGEGARA